MPENKKISFVWYKEFFFFNFGKLIIKKSEHCANLKFQIVTEGNR